jgi:hypothetical protein
MEHSYERKLNRKCNQRFIHNTYKSSSTNPCILKLVKSYEPQIKFVTERDDARGIC